MQFNGTNITLVCAIIGFIYVVLQTPHMCRLIEKYNYGETYDLEIGCPVEDLSCKYPRSMCYINYHTKRELNIAIYLITIDIIILTGFIIASFQILFETYFPRMHFVQKMLCIYIIFILFIHNAQTINYYLYEYDLNSGCIHNQNCTLQSAYCGYEYGITGQCHRLSCTYNNTFSCFFIGIFYFICIELPIISFLIYIKRTLFEK